MYLDENCNIRNQINFKNHISQFIMKKVCITGACGFIGSHLAELFVKKGFDVVILDKYNINNHHGWLETSKFKKYMEFQLGDIRDFDFVNNVLKKVDYCIHLAALIGIPYSYLSPLAYIRTNVEGTYNVLQSMMKSKIKKTIFLSTSEVYGSAQYLPIDELHPLNCQSPYSASKSSADQLVMSYYKSFDLPVKIARPFNTYGPRQSLRAIIPTLISQFLKKRNIIKIGNINTYRDFTYVSDTCEGIYEIFNNKKLYGEVTNIGNNNSISNNDLIELLKKVFKKKNIKLKIERGRLRPKKSEVNKLECDNNKIITNTTWAPKINLKSGLIKTTNWLQKNMHYFKEDIYNI